MPATLKVSIVIPTLNEAGEIRALIEATRKLPQHEIVVVDGGSSDDTVAQAKAADRVIEGSPGRATQQNAAAKVCEGDILLFLHADCRLDDGCLEATRAAMEDPKCAGGCFRQRIDTPGIRFRALEWGNNLRARVLGWGYGDQGIFVRRTVFEQLGGFPEVRFMEDLLFVKQLKKQGAFVALPNEICVSARRWKHVGVVRQTLRNWLFTFLAHCGVSPDRLAGFYADVR